MTFIVLSATFLINLSSLGFTEQSSLDPLTSIRCNEFTFDASSSYDPENKDISFSWDFGDGITSENPVVTHTYNQSGDYNVILSITDNSGLECSTTRTEQLVRANIPPVASFTTSTFGCIEEDILFDASGSYSGSTGKKLNYSWDFGDGQRDFGKPVVTKTYQKGGDYTVKLTVDDNSKTVCSRQTIEKSIQINEPPIAQAQENMILKCVGEEEVINVTFDGSNSYDNDNDNLKYSWDFGDGYQADGIKVTHTYSHIDNYEARLIVTDDSQLECSTAVDFITVRLNKAPKADAGEDIIACTGEILNFDGSHSLINKKGTVTGHWKFGDGQSSQNIKATHSYNKSGEYLASLTLQNQLNESCPISFDTKKVIVNSSPSVSISSIKKACLGDKIDFKAISPLDENGDKYEYYWSFGDGTIQKSGSSISHQYTLGGDYRVTVIADDMFGSNCSTATASVNVKVNTAPAANAGANLSCCMDVETVFDGSGSTDGDGDRLTYIWDFGDGRRAQGPEVTHVYREGGEYPVTLTIDDNSGTECSSSSAGFTANVNAKPVAVMTIR